MYSEKVIAKRIEAASRSLGFQVTLHTLADVDAMNHRLASAYDPEANERTRPLTADETRWIRNERAACQCSFRYWLTRYAYILTIDQRITRCNPNIAQQIILDIWGEMEEERLAIMLQQLKARQLGVSTLTELAVQHRVQFWPNVNAVIASSDPKKSEKMSQMVFRSLDRQPWWLIPARTTDRANLLEFGAHGSAISIQHGNQFSGIARGDTPTVVHLSEIPDFADPRNLIDAALLRAMHETPYTFLVLESTAAGIGNWWHNTWTLSKEGWPDRRSRLRPVFLPWFIGIDVWPSGGPDGTWMRMHPIPSDYEPSETIRKHAERAREYVRSNYLLRRYLGDGWTMPLHQMWFYDVEHYEAVRKKQLPHFLQEMPADDEEAFQTTNLSAFDFETIERCSTNRQPTHGLDDPALPGVYGILGPEDQIPLRLQPARSEIDYNRPSVEIICRWNPSQSALRYTLAPLRWTGDNEDDGLGKIYIWEPPEKDSQYGFGVDLSEGIGLDRSVIEGIRKGTFERNDAQVLEFATPHANSIDLWPVCLALGTLYSTEFDGETRQSHFAIECRWNGENTQFEMRKRGWSNFHLWMRTDSRKFNLRRASKIGWYTNSWSRPQMMDYLIKSVRDEWIDINSKWFIHEMKTLEKEEGAQDLRAQYGEHDDRIMALGFCLYSLHRTNVRGQMDEMGARRKQIRSGEVEPIVYIPQVSERAFTVDEELSHYRDLSATFINEDEYV